VLPSPSPRAPPQPCRSHLAARLAWTGCGASCLGSDSPCLQCRAAAASVDYLHMGRFFEYEMFRSAAAGEYDYLWRLDADIEMRLGIPCDVFDIMVESRAVLGYYYYSDYDHHNCGLFEGRNATLAYARLRG